MKIEPLSRKIRSTGQRTLTGVRITLRAEEACDLAALLSFAANGDLSYDPAEYRRRALMLHRLAAVVEALDGDADAYLRHGTYPEKIAPALKQGYDATRALLEGL